MVGLSLGGSPRFTHMEPLKFIPAPPHQGVAAIRPAHREGEHLFGGKAGGTWEGLDPELPPSSLFPPKVHRDQHLLGASLSAPELPHVPTLGAWGPPWL